MKITALIPARAGSKRIPNKNIVPINGKPLIAYSIETAKKSKYINSVYVSTNCIDTKNVAIDHYALYVWRPNELAGDWSSSEDTLLHFADKQNFDILVFMQATSPLTKFEHLDEGISKILDGKADSVLSVSEDHRFYWNKDHEPINYDPKNRPFSQHKEKWYKETGAFYITTRKALLESKCRISGKIDYVIVPERDSWEIDTYEDLEIIKLLMGGNQHQGC